MTHNSKLSNAVKAALGIGAGSMMLANAGLAQDDPGMVEEVLVTGSKIKRSSYSEGSQVISMDEVQIEALGTLMVADVLRGSPLNSLGSFNERSGSTAMSNASVDLRGLGSDRTLVMIDGRRISGSPNQGANIVNLNMLPMSAVQSIEILADGASAVYGSDAVAGVVNMVMKENFEGFEISTRRAERSQDDGIEEGASIVMGISSDKGNIMFAAEWNRRDPIFDGDRPYTAARDDGSKNLYVSGDGISYYGKTIRLWDNETGYWKQQAATSCDETNGFQGVFAADDAWGTSNGSTACGFAYANVSANKAELNRYNTYVAGNYEIADGHEAYARGLFSAVKSFGRYAPPAAAWPNMPADNPDNPFDIDALIADGSITEDYNLRGYYRWTTIGTRDNEVEDIQYDFTAGLRGDFTDSLSYDAYYQYDKYTSQEIGYYYLSYPGFDYVLANDIDPFSTQGVGLMRATPIQDNESSLKKLYGHVQYEAGDLFGTGDVYFLGGAEYYEMEYKNQYDAHSEVSAIGGSAGNSSAGERDVTAIFAEAVIPIMDGMEVDIAVRYDDYSDFGSQVSPSIAWSWAFNDDLSFRARWGEGFRAPSLSELYGPETFSAEDATDYYTCGLSGIAPADCVERQFDTYYSTNPNLDAETSESLSLGMKWDFMDNGSVDIGFWSVEVSDTIRQETTQSLMYAEAAGIPGSAEAYVDRSSGIEVFSSYTNAGQLEVEGLDVQVDLGFPTDVGLFEVSTLVSQTLDYSEVAYFNGPLVDISGYNLVPELKAQMVASWSMGNHRLDLVYNYLGEHSEADFIEFNSAGNATLATSSDDLDDYDTWDMAYTYDAQSFGKLKIGGRNITDEDPVLDRNGTFPRNHYNLYDNTGRVVYAEYSLAF